MYVRCRSWPSSRAPDVNGSVLTGPGSCGSVSLTAGDPGRAKKPSNLVAGAAESWRRPDAVWILVTFTSSGASGRQKGSIAFHCWVWVLLPSLPYGAEVLALFCRLFL